MKHLAFSATPGRTALVDGSEYLFFSGYAYLGMHGVPEFCNLVKEGLDRYGPLFPSSRISNTRLDIFETAEAALAAMTNSESAVLVSSGFTAGRMAVELWQGQIINLSPSHPAIAAGGLPVQEAAGHRVYAVNAIDPLTASITDFSFLYGEQYPVTMLVDDSHGIGLLGPAGEGVASILPQIPETDYVLCFSLSKALGIPAGAICCSGEQAAVMRNMPAYTAATAPAPAMLYAMLHGRLLYAAQREKLRANTRLLQALLADLPGFRYHPDLPVIILPAGITATDMLKYGIIISSFAYPDPEGVAINRIVVNALHTSEDLERLSGILHKFPVLT